MAAGAPRRATRYALANLAAPSAPATSLGPPSRWPRALRRGGRRRLSSAGADELRRLLPLLRRRRVRARGIKKRPGEPPDRAPAGRVRECADRWDSARARAPTLRRAP